MKSLILNTSEIEEYLSEEMAVETVDFVFCEIGSGRINMPPKTNTDMSGIGHEAWCNAMPAYLKARQVGGIKWIGGCGSACPVVGNESCVHNHRERIFGLPIGIGAYDIAIADIIYEKAAADSKGLKAAIQLP